MSDICKNVYFIWMQLMFGIGTKRAHEVLENCDCPQELYENQVSGQIRLTSGEAGKSSKLFQDAQRALEVSLKNRVDIVTALHPDYPELLVGTYSRPIVLYVKGSLSYLRDMLPIAMVGTRDCTDYGRDAAQDITRGLVCAGCVIVSGLAHGIDTICHETALEEGGITIGVMGCGLDKDYPKDSAVIKTAMKNQGAVVSEYPIGYPASKFTFPVRNRIIAGMTRGTVVVEAPPDSGSLITARLALDNGRDVFAVPGSIYSLNHAGVHNLLKEGSAKTAQSAADILEEYPEGRKYIAMTYKNGKDGVAIGKEVSVLKKNESVEEVTVKPDLPDDVSEELRRIYACIGENPKTADIVAGRANMQIGNVMAALTELEIMGFAQSHPGGFFSLPQ